MQLIRKLSAEHPQLGELHRHVEAAKEVNQDLREQIKRITTEARRAQSEAGELIIETGPLQVKIIDLLIAVQSRRTSFGTAGTPVILACP